MSFPLADLKYAASHALPLVQNVYERYFGTGAISIDGVDHLADITADTRRIKRLAAEDLKTTRLMQAMFADGGLIGTIDRATTDNIGFISFRGTAKGTEWVDDFEFGHANFNFGVGKADVHDGFLKVYKLARPSMMAQLEKLAGVDRLIVTGHSLGAAVATLCALEIKGMGTFAGVDCWTFASPRVFYLHTKLFDENITQSLRVQNPADIVTHVPLVLQLFRHVSGGLLLHPKLEDFHSLWNTYRPGLDTVIAESGRRSTLTLPSEEAPSLVSA